jgi:hypothetical protein
MLRPLGTDIASSHFHISAGHITILPYALSRGDPLTEQAYCESGLPNAGRVSPSRSCEQGARDRALYRDADTYEVVRARRRCKTGNQSWGYSN